MKTYYCIPLNRVKYPSAYAGNNENIHEFKDNICIRCGEKSELLKAEEEILEQYGEVFKRLADN